MQWLESHETYTEYINHGVVIHMKVCQNILSNRGVISRHLAQSVTCLTTDARLAADPGVAR